MKYELGLTARDIITGFEGIITGRVQYLTGCDQYLLQPKQKPEGTFVDARWFDENRIDPLDLPKVTLDTQTANGPCDSAPVK